MTEKTRTPRRASASDAKQLVFDDARLPATPSPARLADAELGRPTSSRQAPLALAAVAELAKRALERLGAFWVEAEVAQLSTPSSGHLYLQLRDAQAVMPAVMWRTDRARVGFQIEVGQRLLLRGRLGVYDRDGRMQLYVDHVEPAGVGAAALALEQLKQQLAAEGLFAAARKRPLPRFPRRIGVVTSKSGAAVHDIIRTVMRRYPTPLAIADCSVQGPTAPAQIVAALVLAVKAGVDVIIVGRGGGASTDLTAFNHERVVRTIARCPVPIISAVGHEVDITLADLAADARASTPTAAAELAVPVRNEIAEVLAKEGVRLRREMAHVLVAARQQLRQQHAALRFEMQRLQGQRKTQLSDLAHALASLHPRAKLGSQQRELAGLERRLQAASPALVIRKRHQQLEALRRRVASASPLRRVQRERGTVATLRVRLAAALAARVELGRSSLAQAAGQLAALSPLAVMARGYALVRTEAGQVVRRPDEVTVGQRVQLTLAEGVLQAEITSVAQPPKEAL